MISLIRDFQKKNLRISNFIKKGKIRATSKEKLTGFNKKISFVGCNKKHYSETFFQ